MNKRIFLVASAAALLASCGPPPAPCDRAAGSCLSVSLGGQGQVDFVGFTVVTGGTQKAGNIGEGACVLPCAIEVLPPAGVASSSISALTIHALARGKDALDIALKPFSWPDGARLSQSYYLGDLR